MKHHHFGTGRRLFGSLEQPTRLQSRSAAVLLCNPFGEEAVRAHRIHRVLSERLAAAGYPVLRFDYSGTGDSEGETSEATVERWVEDVDVAATELLGVTRSRRLVAVGLRLGGALAALAAARSRRRLRHLVLWDPVVSGAAYLRELADMHRAYLRAEMGPDWADGLAVDPDGFPAEALGGPITAPLAAGIAAIDLVAAELRADHVTAVCTRSTPELEGLRGRLDLLPGARWIPIVGATPWNSDEGLNSAIVPMDVVQAILARIEDVSP